MFKFYSVTFTNKLGHQTETFVIGTLEQVKAWTEKESYALGCTFEINYITTDRLAASSAIKNLCNY